jgi:hypothetical protein
MPNHSTERQADMRAHRFHLAGVAAVLTTIAVAAPVSTAGAATGTGQTFVNTAASTFTNYHSQTSADALTSGRQVSP